MIYRPASQALSLVTAHAPRNARPFIIIILILIIILFHLLESSAAITRQFDHEQLSVFQTAVIFVARSSDLLTDVPKNTSVYNEFDRTSTSIPFDTAEGNRK